MYVTPLEYVESEGGLWKRFPPRLTPLSINILSILSVSPLSQKKTYVHLAHDAGEVKVHALKISPLEATNLGLPSNVWDIENGWRQGPCQPLLYGDDESEIEEVPVAKMAGEFHDWLSRMTCELRQNGWVQRYAYHTEEVIHPNGSNSNFRYWAKWDAEHGVWVANCFNCAKPTEILQHPGLFEWRKHKCTDCEQGFNPEELNDITS